MTYEVEGCSCVSNAKVYGLEDSIRRAKFPMSVNTGSIISPDELSFWERDGFLRKFISHIDGNEYPLYSFADDGSVIMQIRKEDGTVVDVLLDEEDVPKIFPYKWHCDKYCKSAEAGFMHRLIMGCAVHDNGELVVDHINRNPFDNRKENLRLATKQQNGFNSKIRDNNKSGVMGVSWSTDKRKWRAYLSVDGCQLFLGYYDTFDDAVKARLIKEQEICGAFAPQAFLFEKYQIQSPTLAKDCCKKLSLQEAIAAHRNIARLANTQKGTGHDQALTGVIVQFDLSFSNKAWVEAERYHFLDFVSSQSTMHRITKFNLDKAYNRYVDRRIVALMKGKVARYNEESDPEKRKEMYLEILYSNPAGFIITAGMTTNYRQLKTIYAQRKDHRLPEWREFCKWIERLPMSELITGELE